MNFWMVMLAVWAAIFIDNFLGAIVKIVVDLHRSHKKKKVVVVNSDPRPVTYKEYNENYIQPERVLRKLKATKMDCELLLKTLKDEHKYISEMYMNIVDAKEEFKRLAKEAQEKELDVHDNCIIRDWYEPDEEETKTEPAP